MRGRDLPDSSTTAATSAGSRGGGRRFLRDAASLYVAGSLSQVCQLASAVTLAFLLGAQGQGLFISAIALQAFGHCLIHLGVPQATANQISANAARGRSEKVTSWMALLLKANSLFALGLLLLGYFVFPVVAERLLHRREIGVWAWWLCLGPLLEVPRDVVRVGLQGTRRMRALGEVENGHELARFFLVSVGALVSGSAAGAVVGSLCASALASGIAITIYGRVRAEGRVSLPRVREVLAQLRDIPLRKGLRQGIRISFLKNLHTLLLTVVPRLVIQSVVGSHWVAYYHIAGRLMSLPQVLATAISRTALPAMGELAGRRDGRAFRRVFVTTTLVSGTTITTAIWAGLLALPWFLALVFPPDYAEPVMRFAVILAIGESAAAFCVCLESFFISANRVRALYVLAAGGFVLALPVSLWLMATVAVTGAAWGVVVLRMYHLTELGYASFVFWGRRHSPDLWCEDKRTSA